MVATRALRFLQLLEHVESGTLLPSPESETARCPYVVTPWPRVHGCHSPGLCSVTNRNVTITQGTGHSEQRNGLRRPQL